MPGKSRSHKNEMSKGLNKTFTRGVAEVSKSIGAMTNFSQSDRDAAGWNSGLMSKGRDVLKGKVHIRAEKEFRKELSKIANQKGAFTRGKGRNVELARDNKSLGRASDSRVQRVAKQKDEIAKGRGFRSRGK